jgi:tripartite-type tricarboxylate transporter receptor subunit TctC
MQSLNPGSYVMTDQPALTVMDRRALLAASAGIVLPAVARAQGPWPARAVTIVEGYPPGGVTDITSRAVAERMAGELGQVVVVDNRPGAATSVAAASVVRARNDGYTLLMGTTTLAINQTLQPALPPRDPAREFDPVGLVFRTSFILHVHPTVPARTVPELIAHAKANPGKVIFGSPGVGSVSHLCLELFRTTAEIEIEHVPYRGGAPAALDLAAGRVHAIFQGVQEALPFLRAGQTRGIGVSLRTRNPDFPDLAPVADTLPSFGEVTFWQGLFAPAGTPQAVLERAGAALRVATQDLALRARMREQGVDLVTGDAGALRGLLAAETERWGRLIRAANIRVE